LRAGEGHSFFWRRLHSLSGIFPVGAFLVEHYISNAYATNGVHAYNEQVRFLTSLPFVLAVETAFIYIPLLYHALYGLYIWYRGEANVGDYPWAGNWGYTVQRWTGVIAFVYIGYHTWTMRFTGAHLIGNSEAAFAKVYLALQNPWVDAFYFIGIVCAAWHFGYGIYLFCAKWGIIVGEKARKRMFVVSVLVFVVMVTIGAATMYKFMAGPAANEHQAYQDSLDAYQKSLHQAH
jgi:succinate dehydrogenase / fumarate reductase cytochrome b subunit